MDRPGDERSGKPKLGWATAQCPIDGERAPIWTKTEEEGIEGVQHPNRTVLEYLEVLDLGNGFGGSEYMNVGLGKDDYALGPFNRAFSKVITTHQSQEGEEERRSGTGAMSKAHCSVCGPMNHGLFLILGPEPPQY